MKANEPDGERRSADQRLRERGFTIHARPKAGPVLWKDAGGEVYTQAECLKTITRDDLKPKR